MNQAEQSYHPGGAGGVFMRYVKGPGLMGRRGYSLAFPRAPLPPAWSCVGHLSRPPLPRHHDGHPCWINSQTALLVSLAPLPHPSTVLGSSILLFMPPTPNPAIISLQLGWTETWRVISGWRLSEVGSLPLHFVKSPWEIPNHGNRCFFGHDPRLLPPPRLFPSFLVTSFWHHESVSIMALRMSWSLSYPLAFYELNLRHITHLLFLKLCI